MRRTRTTLADGRELDYYDASDAAPPRDTPDSRPLPARSGGSQLRWDPLREEWVVVAAHRQERTFLPPDDACPLCPSTPRFASEVPGDDYEVVVFENRFPSLGGPIPAFDETLGSPLVPYRPGEGRCEVVCFTSEHVSSLAEQPVERVRLVVEAWADRTAELSALPNVEQVFLFENRGEEIGVTLHHPHGQIYAVPFLTPRTAREIDAARSYRERTGRSLHGDLLAAEEEAKIRVVSRGEHWTAFVPEFARWPVEVNLYPHRQVPDLAALTPAERDDLAATYLDLLRRLDRFYEAADGTTTQMPYISMWHQAPVGAGRDLGWLHLEVFTVRRAPGKLKYLAGAESGMGLWINDRFPEAAAERLRSVAGNEELE